MIDNILPTKKLQFDWKYFSRIVILFLILRIILGVWMWGVRKVYPSDPVTVTTSMYKGTVRETSPWLEPWQRWDTLHYQAIAERGYTAFDTALFTPPLYPLLMKLFMPFAGGNSLLAGLSVANIALIFCLFVLFKLVDFEFNNKELAWRTVLFLATFPTSFFLFAAYTESLFLLGAVLTILFIRQRKWIPAGICGAAVALTRTPGILIIIPMAYAALVAMRTGEYKAWVAPIITATGAAIFPAYVFLGLHLSPTVILEAVGRGGHVTVPGWNIIEAVIHIFRGQLVEENIIEVVFTILFIVLTVFIWKKLPRIYGIYAMIFMLLFVTRLGTPQPLVSMARYVLEIFPAFLILAMWGQKPWPNRIILYLSWLGLLFFSAQFAIWGWVG